MKTRRSVYNICGNLLNQFITIVLGILIPRLVLTNLGSEANGLMNSITQVFAYINLLEAGVGVATVQALYKPLSINDRNGINSILTATKKYYTKIAFIYLFVLLLFAGIYPLLVTSGYSNAQIALIILFTGGNAFFNFNFQGKYRLFLEAEGKLYILTNINTVIYIANSISKSVLLVCGFDLVAIQFGYFIMNFFQLVFIELYMHKKYKWISFKVKPDYKAISQKNSVLIHQFSTVIFSNTDVLLLTFLCDLKVASVYSVYQLVIGMINTALHNTVNSIQFAFGQKYNTDFKQYKRLLNAFEAYYCCLCSALFTVTFLLLIPFIRIYTESVTDIKYVDSLVAVLFIGRELAIFGRVASQSSINVAGHFQKTVYRSLAETVINLVVSIFGVLKFGIYGALFGTIVASLYRTNDIILYSHKYILKDSPKKSYMHWILGIVLCVIIGVFIFPLVHGVDSILGFIVWGIILVAVVFPLCFAITSVLDKSAFKVFKEYFLPKIKSIFNKLVHVH